MTMKQNNLFLLETPNTKDDMGYDDTIRPEQVQMYKKEQQQSFSVSEPAPFAHSRPENQSSTQSNPLGQDPRNSPPKNVNEDSRSTPQAFFASFFTTLSKDSLNQLFEMVEMNECREIQSIQNEFQPKLDPIYKGIEYLQMKKN
jgi:hypothetical protein